MSIIIGSILGKPTGKSGGIVFGSARSRTGKVTTARSFVPPSNPNSAGQQIQRSKFSSCQDIVRRLGTTIYQSDFNRSIGQLPGFQSLNSIFLNQMAANLDLTLVTPINLGVLYPPPQISVSNQGSDSFRINYSSDLGSNGTANDVVVVLLVAKTAVARAASIYAVASYSALRSAAQIDVGDLDPSTDFEIYLYVRGAGTAAGLLSVANILSASTTA